LRLKGRAVTYNSEGLPTGFLAREEGGSARKRPGSWARLLVGALVLAVALFALVAADYALGRGEIHRGVAVGEVAVGGMSRQEARAALEERAAEQLREIPLRGRGDRAIAAEEVGLRLDAEATVERAYSVGREGSVFERVRQRAGAVLGGSEGMQVEPVVDYEREALRAEIEGLAAELDSGSSEAGVRLTGSGAGLFQSPEAYRIDVEASVQSVERVIRSLGGEAELVGASESELGAAEEERALKRARRAVEEPLVLAYGDGRWTLSTERLAAYLRLSGGEVELDRAALGGELENALGALEREPADARMVSGESGSVEVEPSSSGREVLMERLLDEIQAGIFEGRHRYEVPTSTVGPDLTTEEAEAAKPNTMLGEFETGYRVYDEPARVRNLGTASEAVDGTILAPGETFSFNAAAAPLARYEPSDVIVDGQLDTALGGGLCQVASTLYMAANYAGLEIVERHPHYAELPYIRPGFDATVWFGSLDLKFRNDTGGYLLLEERVDEESGEVAARIYGQPTGREVEMASRRLSDSGETTRWRSTREVLENGRVVERGALNTDTYQPLQPAAPAPTGRGA
jgi:vancomycin resistance protein YoaR